MKTNPRANSSDVEKAKQELLAIHASHRKAHFDTDAQALTANQAERTFALGPGQTYATI